MTIEQRDGKSNSPPGDVNLPGEPPSIAKSPVLKNHLSSTRKQNGYRRMDSQGSVQLLPDAQPPNSTLYSSIPSVIENGASESASVSQGLGISRVSSTRSRKSPSPPNPSSALQSPTLGSLVTSPATSQRPLLSPAWTQDTYYEGLDQGNAHDEPLDEVDISRGKISAFTESLDAAFESVEDLSKLKNLHTGDSHAGGGGHDHSGCTSSHDIHSRARSWLSISVIILSIYSTIFSGIWFFIGVIRPRFPIIRTGGSLNPSTASIVFAIFAKTIELSFVTIFVTFLGQVLSRRSLVKTSSGVTVAELTMRTWVIQPGFMITNPKVLRTAGLSVLGAITLTAAVVAMFYTTASDALVNPSLQLGHWHYKNMSGFVESEFGNITFVSQNCQTPIPNSEDSDSASTCISIDHAGEAYHNFLEFSRTWATINTPGGKGNSSKLAERPNATAMLYDNTTVTGAWVDTEYSDIATNYQKHKRIINNVTMAMPHSGIIAAASSHVNKILQPSDLDGVGEYSVKASVVSPAIHVLCANMNASELSPLIYVDWPNAKTNDSDYPGQKTAWTGWQRETALQPGQEYFNSTVVDDIFGWRTTKDGLTIQPPVFPMLPINFNIISNATSLLRSPYIYTLVKSNSTTDYTLCQMSGYLWPHCSTSYSASGKTGGALKTRCNDPNDDMIYSKSEPDPPTNIQPDFRDVLTDWVFSMSLNTGITNSNASIGRILSQFVVTKPQFNTHLPSIAEALAALAGCTLLIGAESATFKHYWGGSLLSAGVYEPFNATIASQEYQSGPQQPWQKIFYLVLILVFFTNIFCLGYFIRQRGLVTDFTATQNLFALAVNSPPSRRLGGSCGAGPEGDQLNVDFHIQCAEDSSHFYLKEGNGVYENSGFELRNRKRSRIPTGLGSALKERTATTYSKLSNKRASIL